MKSAVNYTERGCTIPDNIARALDRWATLREMPGGFLQAVLENDLMRAIGKADNRSLAGLPAICVWLYNEAPSDCYGSPAKVDAWFLQREAYDGPDYDEYDEPSCAHEWNQTEGEADETGTRIYCLKCGEDGDG